MSPFPAFLPSSDRPCRIRPNGCLDSIRFRKTHGNDPFMLRPERAYGSLTDEPAELSARGADFAQRDPLPTQAPPTNRVNSPALIRPPQAAARIEASVTPTTWSHLL